VDPDVLPLATRPQVIAASRIDIMQDGARLEALQARAAELDLACYPISAVTGEGVQALLEALWPHVEAGREERRQAHAATTELPVPEDEPQETGEAPRRPPSRTLDALRSSRRSPTPPVEPQDR